MAKCFFIQLFVDYNCEWSSSIMVGLFLFLSMYKYFFFKKSYLILAYHLNTNSLKKLKLQFSNTLNLNTNFFHKDLSFKALKIYFEDSH